MTHCAMVDIIEKWSQTKPNEPALFDMRPGGSWATQDWKTFWHRVRAVGRGLIAIGVEPGDRVAMIAKNRSEWLICQHGIAAAGAILCPIYATNLSHQVAHIIESCGADILILDEREQLEKLRAAQANGQAKLRTIVTMDSLRGGDDVMTLADLEASGHEDLDRVLDQRLRQVNVDSPTMLIFTSGTTGLPKGAEITNRGVRALMSNVMAIFGEAMGEGEQRVVSYLPLCHAAEQLFTNYIGLTIGAQIYFCREMAELKAHLATARPTYILGVPRVWEKFESAMRAQFAKATGLKSRMISWARGVELECMRREIEIGEPHWPTRRKIARKLVIDKILLSLGLDDLRLACSGAAPISEESIWFFASIGLLIHEGFGMTETSGLAITQPLRRIRVGTVGKPIPGVEAKVSETGELLLRGLNMVRGYFLMPEHSRDLWSDEWMRTGDMASIDSDGFVTITGRIKELIITAGGKNVGPVEIENHLLQIIGIGQAIAVGDRRPYLVAVMTLDSESLPQLLRQAGAATTLTAAEASADPKVRALVWAELEEKCNKKLARYQQIKNFALLPEPFSEAGGELTPTQKLKRSAVHERHKAIIDALYQSVDPRVTA
jgi:long-chain acyl-CoA synthetase